MVSPKLSEARRAELVALLQERAQLLKPSGKLVRQALQRCVRHDRRSGRVGSLPGGSTMGTEASGKLQQLVELEEAVPSAVAAAPTIPEEDSQVPPPASSSGSSKKSAPILKPGQEIEGYSIVGQLGSGGMGQVYRARQISMNREVAFKVLAPRFAGNDSFRNRFIREARNAGRLQHPNLIAVHDVSEKDGLLFFSMELVSGRSVGDIIKADGPFEEARALAIVAQVLDALTYAHENGVVHRDIKPDNLMLTDNGVVKVADLGLSRGIEDGLDGSTTQTGTMMGTPFYMPPEQGRDAHSADHRADIYALGATLYHMVCGKVPYTGRTAVEVVLNASTKSLAFPSDKPGGAVKRLIAKLMAKDPDERPGTALEALGFVNRVLDGVTKGGTTDHLYRGERSAYLTPAQPSLFRRLLPWSVSGLVALVLITGGLLFITQAERRNQWATVQSEVADFSGSNKFSKARSSIDRFMASYPDFTEARTLRANLIREWNMFAMAETEGHRELILERMSTLNFEGAVEVVHEVDRNPDLSSPEVEVLMDKQLENIGETERAIWTALEPRVRQLTKDKKYTAARHQLENFRPADSGLRTEREKLLSDVRKTLAITDMEPAFKARIWLENAPVVNPKAKGSLELKGDRYQLKGHGSRQLNNLSSNPDAFGMEWVLKVPEGADVKIHVGSSREGRLFEISPDRVRLQIAKMASLAFLGGVSMLEKRLAAARREGRELPRGDVRERVRKKWRESLTPIGEQSVQGPVQLAFTFDQKYVTVTVVGTTLEVVRLPRSAVGQQMVTLFWSAKERPIELMVHDR